MSPRNSPLLNCVLPTCMTSRRLQGPVVKPAIINGRDAPKGRRAGRGWHLCILHFSSRRGDVLSTPELPLHHHPHHAILVLQVSIHGFAACGLRGWPRSAQLR